MASLWRLPLAAALALALAGATLIAPPAGAQDLDVEVVATDLDTIWAIDFAPDGRIFLTERGGRVRTVRDGRLDPEPWISLEVVEVAESGLLGLALDPGFAQNGYVYVAYTYATGDGNLQNRLVRLREDPATGRGAVDAVVLDDASGGRVHDGGRVKFGPDGKLYWTMGDAGNQELAQNLASLNGKILRINSDGSIPEDNPFPGSPIYSYGHRNAQGLAWQPGTNRLYAIEHGPSGQQSCCDEVNYIQPGMNYGWPRVFGEQTADGIVPPIIQSGPTRETTWAPGGATFAIGGPWAGSCSSSGCAVRRSTAPRSTRPSPRPCSASSPSSRASSGACATWWRGRTARCTWRPATSTAAAAPVPPMTAYFASRCDSVAAGVGVLPAFRRRGIAAALTGYLVDDARRRGIRTIFLSAGEETIARVYERVAFRRVGTACTAEPAMPAGRA